MTMHGVFILYVKWRKCLLLLLMIRPLDQVAESELEEQWDEEE